MQSAFKDSKHSHLEEELHSVEVLEQRNRRSSFQGSQGKRLGNPRMLSWLGNNSKDILDQMSRYNIIRNYLIY